MKRFLLGIVVGFLVVSSFRSPSRAYPPLLVGPAGYVRRASYEPRAPIEVVRNDPNAGFPPARDGRETVQDIPVPILPGTRVTEAQIQPPNAAPRGPTQPRQLQRRRRVPPPGVVAPQSDLRVITGRISADEERAKEDVRKAVDHAIVEWLAPEVASSWQPPASLREALVQKTEVRPVEQSIDGERRTMFEASQTVDFSPARRTALVEAYHSELVARRLAILAGILAFILTCLAALAGYIRTDEATKGYYTNRLRLVSAAGVGAAGVLIYQLLV